MSLVLNSCGRNQNQRIFMLYLHLMDPKVRMILMRRDLSKYLFILLLPAVICLFINATVNRHNHYLFEGYLISHAHPYDKTPLNPDPRGSHHHNEAELFLLSLISDPATTTSIVFLLTLFLIAVNQLFKNRYHDSETIREFFQVRNYHAPPIFLTSSN